MKKKLFVGIDVSKKTVDVTFFHIKDIRKTEYKQFENNQKGYKEMIKWIFSLTKFNKEEIIFCLENTGTYSLLFSKLFIEENYFVWVENPLQIKQSLGIKRGKNDKLDSSEIAMYVYRFQDKAKLFKMPSNVLIALQDLEAYRERLVHARTALSQAGSELREFDKNNSKFIKKSTADIVENLNKQIEEIATKIEQLIESDEELKKMFELVISVVGIGTQIAVYVLIHTQCFKNFENVRQFACYCGIAPFEHTSGTSVKGRTKVSHLANKKLKSLLHMGALVAVRCDPELKAFYDRKKEEGKHHLSIMNMIKNKLIQRVFAVIKRGEKFMKYEEFKQYKKVA